MSIFKKFRWAKNGQVILLTKYTMNKDFIIKFILNTKNKKFSEFY